MKQIRKYSIQNISYPEVHFRVKKKYPKDSFFPAHFYFFLGNQKVWNLVGGSKQY